MCDQCSPDGPDYGLLEALERFAGRVVEYQTPLGYWARGQAAEECGYDSVAKAFTLFVHQGPLVATHVTDPLALRLPGPMSTGSGQTSG